MRYGQPPRSLAEVEDAVVETARLLDVADPHRGIFPLSMFRKAYPHATPRDVVDRALLSAEKNRRVQLMIAHAPLVGAEHEASIWRPVRGVIAYVKYRR